MDFSRSSQRGLLKPLVLPLEGVPWAFAGRIVYPRESTQMIDLVQKKIGETQMRRIILWLIVCLLSFIGIAAIISSAMAAENATVSFGQWLTDPPLDRIATPAPAGGAGVHDEIIPNVTTIEIPGDGAVNFIIGGLHNPQVYDDGTQPEDIDTALVLTAGRAAGGIIDDPDHRIYRGPDPNLPENPRDRVEVVRFSKPGTYLVICGVRNHFVNNGMFGFVRVISQDTN
jgi:hypothetical protein